MNKFYKEICFLETKKLYDFELNNKYVVLVRRILNFLSKKIEISSKEQIGKGDKEKKDGNAELNNNDINKDNNNLINESIENNINNNENEN